MVRFLLLRSSTSTFLAALAFSRPIQGFRSIRPKLSYSALQMSSKQVLVPIADGSEEIETTCITDTLTRFGAQVTVASVKADGDLLCTMSRGIKVQADASIVEAAKRDWDMIVLPGGMPGAAHLRDSEPLIALLKKQKADGKLYGAICAAPAVALASHGLIEVGASSTCYPAPAHRAMLENVSEDAVVVANNLTTSQGPGTAIQFALQLGEHLYGKEKRDEIAKQMLVD
jgi:protein deglycase